MATQQIAFAGVNGVDGDSRPSTVNHYLSVSSGDRDKSQFSNSNDCEIGFDELRNALSIELLNFELPHTKYAINSDNNTLYISEQISEKGFNFFGLRVATSGYFVSDLAVALELSTRCPLKFSTDENLRNTYNFVASTATGKVSVISSGDVSFNIHNCQETLKVVDLKKNSDTEVTVQFLAPFEYIVSPGAILRLSLYNQVDLDVQVVLNDGPRVVTVIGDFSFLDDTLLDLTGATMIPVSAQSCVSEVIGFGVVDFQPGGNDRFTVLGMESPFSKAVQAESGLVSPMVCVEFPAFVSADDYVQLTGTQEYLQQAAARVAVTHDDTHFELEYNPSDAFEGYGTSAVTQDGQVWQVDSITVQGASNSDASVVVTFGETTSNLSAGDTLTITGLTGDHWLSPPSLTLGSVSSATEITGVVRVPSVLVDTDHGTKARPVNPATGNSTTYTGPSRYDLSRGRRIIMCRMGIDDLDVGSISIPRSQLKFFGRIQLFSGADLVNFLGTDNAKGEHTFNSLVKRLQSVRLRFYNDNGTPYNFEGVDFSMFLKVVCLNSNTGL